jgi:isocitrate dehydrogenase kinase/phosphatase
MDISTVANVLAQRIAEAMIDGFNRHYRLIREILRPASQAAVRGGDWRGVHDAVRERIQFYDDRVSETAELLHAEFAPTSLDDNHLAAGQAAVYIGN